MKNIFSLLLISGSLFFFSGCAEKGPAIDLGTGPKPLLDTTYMESTPPTADNKTVLIEEFTGVQCINCANGQTAVHRLDSIHAGRVFSVALHSSFLDLPYAGSPNLQPIFDGVNKANTISSTYASAAAVNKPAAMVDRHQYGFSTTPEISGDLAGWGTAVDERLALSSPCNVIVSSIYDTANDSVRIHVEVHYTSAVTATHKLSVYLVESGVIAEQLMPDGSTEPDHVHENVMRDMITPITGASLSASLDVGRVFIKEFGYKIPADWNPDEMKAIAFVHDGSSKDVVQVAECNLK